MHREIYGRGHSVTPSVIFLLIWSTVPVDRAHQMCLCGNNTPRGSAAVYGSDAHALFKLLNDVLKITVYTLDLFVRSWKWEPWQLLQISCTWIPKQMKTVPS
jgi:hypothetical protein